jgi:hypothetical protein
VLTYICHNQNNGTVLSQSVKGETNQFDRMIQNVI